MIYSGILIANVLFYGNRGIKVCGEYYSCIPQNRRKKNRRLLLIEISIIICIVRIIIPTYILQRTPSIIYRDLLGFDGYYVIRNK